MWSDCRARFGRGGPFLFGAFTAADAMYAPVVSRFVTYAVDVGAAARAYMEAVVALPAWREWTAAALKETWVLPQDEPDWPTVHEGDARRKAHAHARPVGKRVSVGYAGKIRSLRTLRARRPGGGCFTASALARRVAENRSRPARLSRQARRGKSCVTLTASGASASMLGDDVDDHRPVGGERLGQRGREVARLLDADADRRRSARRAGRSSAWCRSTIRAGGRRLRLVIGAVEAALGLVAAAIVVDDDDRSRCSSARRSRFRRCDTRSRRRR